MASPHVFFGAALIVLTIVSSFANASDPSPLQDFCVALPNSYLNVNGFPCKNPESVTINDFYYSGLNLPRNTNNKLGSNVTTVNVANLPGLNTLGISLARLDFAPYGGLNPPHTHPRATELLLVLEGTLTVGFVTSNSQNKLFSKVLYPGDVFVFPIGLIHFQVNLGNTNALAISALSSQNPGTITIANAVFGSNPPISTTILAKAFQISPETVSKIQYYF